MRTAVMNDRAMVSNIIRAFLELSTDNTGQMVNAKCVDRVMHDILDQRKFVVRLCRAAKNEMELISLFNGVSISDIYGILSDEGQFLALRQTVMLQREIQALKLKIKKKIKKGSKPKKDQEYCHKLEKIYKKSIKTFKNVLNIKDSKKSSKPKDKYSAIVKFSKRYSDNDGFYSYLLDDDFDYDDLEEYTPSAFSPEELSMIGGVRQGKSKYAMSPWGIEEFGDPDDDDEDDYDEDIEDLRQEMADRFDSIDDKFQKMISSVGKLISIHEGTVPSNHGNITTSEEVTLIDDDDESDDDLRGQVRDLSTAVSKIIEFIETSFPDQPATNDGRPRPVPMPVYEPDYSHPQPDAEVMEAMNAMFADDEDEPLKVNGVVPQVDPSMSTPEVIEARNAEVAGGAQSITEMVDDDINGKRS